MSVRSLKWIVLGPVLALLLVGYSFGGKWPVPPGRQPAQFWSKVRYDPKLTDPFFKSNEWSYPWYIIKHPDGTFEDITSDKRPEKEPSHLKHTAKCFITAIESGRAKDLVTFCKARFHNVNTIDVLIHKENSADIDRLKVQIKNGMFASQYWTVFKKLARARARIIWTTTRQKLILDRKEYRKDDVIKGRIDFECVEEPTDPRYVEKWGRKPITIRVNGVFKTRVE
jgi:hypothetical protein